MKSFQKKKKSKLFLLGLLGFLGVLVGVWLVKNQLTNPKVTSSLVSPVVPEESLKVLFRNIGEEITGTILDKGDYLVATISSGTTIYFKKEEGYVKTLASLQLIFKNIRIEGRWPVKIDLRFSRPIFGY